MVQGFIKNLALLAHITTDEDTAPMKRLFSVGILEAKMFVA